MLCRINFKVIGKVNWSFLHVQLKFHENRFSRSGAIAVGKQVLFFGRPFFTATPIVLFLAHAASSFFLDIKRCLRPKCLHKLGKIGPTVQELWPFKVVQATKNAPLGRFFKKIILEVIFFWRQARNLTQTHPSNFPIGSRTLIFPYLDKKCPKWPKKRSKKRPKTGLPDTCELIAPKLSS